MIEEQAVITRVDAVGVWVRTLGTVACSRCAEGQGCERGGLARLMASHQVEMRVRAETGPFREGEHVMVGIDERAVMHAAVVVYLVPLVAMLLLGAFAHQALEAGDPLVAAFGLTGLVAGFCGSRRYAAARQGDARFEPRILRRVRAHAADASDS